MLAYSFSSLIRAVRRIVLFVTLASLPALVSPVHAEVVRISGTGDALGAIGLLAEAYMRVYPDSQIKVLASVGSSGAIKGVGQKRLDIGLTSGPLTEEARATGLVDLEYAATPTVVVVSSARKIKAMTRQRLAEAFSGAYPSWPDGTPVRPIMRRLSESTFEKVMSLSPEVERAVRGAAERQGLPYANSDQEMADMMERIPGALGVATLGMVLSEKRNVQPLTLDGVAPTPENAASGRYPIHKRHFLITRTQASAEVTRFVAFVRSPDGRAILRAHGYWFP